MRRTRRNLLIVGGVALLAVCLLVINWRCGAVKEQQVVRFGSGGNAVDYGPYLVAKNKGWYEEALKAHGLTPEYTVFQTPAVINESFAANRVDIVVVAEPPVIVGRAAGVDIKIVGISCGLIQQILVPSNSDVRTIAGLKGKRVAVVTGSSSHYGLFKILEKGGLQPSEVEVIDMIPPDAKSAFQTRRVDAWAVWPPWIEQEEIAGTGSVLEGADIRIYSLVTVRGDFARKYPDVLRDVLAVNRRAKQWIIDNPDEAQEVIAKELGVSTEVVKRTWPRHDWKVRLDDKVLAEIQDKAGFLKQNGFIKQGVDVRGDMLDLSLAVE